ncbi:MAG: transglutaminase domain-containing protein [Stomatobaculum sp.]
MKIKQTVWFLSVFLSAATGVMAMAPSAVYAAEIIRRRAAVSSGAATPDPRGDTFPEPEGGERTGNIIQDLSAPAATGAYGYTAEDARAAAEALYSFETNAVKKEVDISYLLNSIWYDPANIMAEEDGHSVLRLYGGTPENYRRAYLEALDGLEFFSAPTVLFLTEQNGGLLVGVETGERFTEQQAAENYHTILDFLQTIEEVKAVVAEKDDTDKAKYISDYVAARLTYDDTHQKNSLGDALRSGVTACVGYNTLTELLFEHCGLPYISIVAAAKNEDMEHIFGMSRIGSSWLIFDTTNYDRDNGVRETYWIFSDRYRAGRYYQNFRLVEEAPSEGGAERREAAREAFGIF